MRIAANRKSIEFSCIFYPTLCIICFKFRQSPLFLVLGGNLSLITLAFVSLQKKIQTFSWFFS